MWIDDNYGPHSPAPTVGSDVNPRWLAHPLRKRKVVEKGVFQINHLPKNPKENKFTLKLTRLDIF